VGGYRGRYQEPKTALDYIEAGRIVSYYYINGTEVASMLEARALLLFVGTKMLSVTAATEADVQNSTAWKQPQLVSWATVGS
jgi:hypothetical protein